MVLLGFLSHVIEWLELILCYFLGGLLFIQSHIMWMFVNDVEIVHIFEIVNDIRCLWIFGTYFSLFGCSFQPNEFSLNSKWTLYLTPNIYFITIKRIISVCLRCDVLDFNCICELEKLHFFYYHMLSILGPMMRNWSF